MIRRNITSNLLNALADTPVVLLNGARQSGKSTLVKAIAEGGHPAAYFNLDDVSALGAVRHDAAGFLSGLDGPVVIDEIQRAPELFMAIKSAVDRNRRPGRFLLTGSANILLLPRLSESLAGRMEILSLWPFSQGEINGIKEAFVDKLFEKRLPRFPLNKKEGINIIDRIIAGGYPEAVSRTVPARRKAWFDSYITTILQRDVRDIADIDGLSDMPRLLSLIAIRSPSLLNFAEISRTIAIPQTTLKRYMMLLEATFLIRNLPAWSGHLGKRLVKTSKLIMCDTALMAHLFGANRERIVSAGLIGPLLENFVIMELQKQITWSEIRPKMFHFRTQTGQEVDIVLEDSSGRLVGIEVKASATVGAKDFNGLKALAEITGNNFIRGIILYTGDNIIPFGNNLHVLPVSAIWSKNSA